MAIRFEEKNEGKILEVFLTGKLVAEDYEGLVPAMDRLVAKHAKIRMLVAMHDFHGWTGAALWQDTKFSARHFNDLERLAMVGEEKWQKGMAAFCKPFTTATVRYFDYAALVEARLWLESP